MTAPDFDADGWCLEDGEERHRQAPDQFWIPTLQKRKALQPGDLAKLIFRIAPDDDDEPVAIERMWVLVTERLGDQYLGVLANQPCSIAENPEFWLGVELPFEARHVIAIEEGSAATREKAKAPPSRVWPRDE